MCSSSSRRLPAVSRRPSSTGTSLTNYAPRTGRSGCLAELSQSLDWSRRVDMGAFDPSAACFVRHGGVIPGLAEGVTGWLAGQRVAGGSRSSGGCRHRVRKAGVDSRGLARVPVWQGRVRGAGATAGGGCCGQHKSNTSPGPGGVQHGRNGIRRHTLARVFKIVVSAQLPGWMRFKLAGVTDEYSPGGIGRDRPSEKRKVGSSTLPLTTIASPAGSLHLLRLAC